MNTIIVEAGSSIRIELDGADGAFEIHFDSKQHPKQLIVKEVDGLPGNVVGAALGILYQENFAFTPLDPESGGFDTLKDERES